MRETCEQLTFHLRASWHAILNIHINIPHKGQLAYLILLALAIIITCGPSRVHDHVFLALFARHFIIFLLFFLVQRVPLKQPC